MQPDPRITLSWPGCAARCAARRTAAAGAPGGRSACAHAPCVAEPPACSPPLRISKNSYTLVGPRGYSHVPTSRAVESIPLVEPSARLVGTRASSSGCLHHVIIITSSSSRHHHHVMQEGTCAVGAVSVEDVAANGLALSNAAGALLVLPQQVGRLKEVLQQRGCLLKGRSICRWESPVPTPMKVAASSAGELMAIHLTAEMAAVLNDPGRGAQVPQPLADALASGEVVWQPGVRLGSNVCGGPRGKQCDSSVYALRAAVFSRPIWRPPIPPQRFRFVELFAGIGGFRLGLEAVGGRCVFASERDVHACTTYHSNFGDVPFGDITQIDTATIPAHDLLTAGFPCQSFSRAGALNPETGQQGLEDANGKLFFEVVRVLDALQPRGFLLENVAELVTHNEGWSHAIVVAALRGIGYCVDWRIINSLAEVPQHRERLYLVGLRADLSGASAERRDDWRFPWPPGLEVGERCQSTQPFGRRCPCRRLNTSGSPALRHILQPEIELPSDIWLTTKQWSKVSRSSACISSRGPSSSIPASNGGNPLVARSEGGGATEPTPDPQPHCQCCRRLAWLDGAARTLMSSYRRGYEMCSEFVPCPAMQPDGGSGTRVRFLTRRECARLMGFPEWFRVDLDFGLASGGGATKKHEAVDGNRFYAQIGNAVCPPIVTALAGPLLDLMNIPRHDSTFAEVSAGRTEHSMEIDCQRSKRKREMERHACAARPECGCSKVFVLG